MKLEFSWQIVEKYSKSPYFTQIRLVGAELFHADGRTDTTKLIFAFRNFANAPKIEKKNAIHYTGLESLFFPHFTK
jgi:hypothetical protein